MLKNLRNTLLSVPRTFMIKPSSSILMRTFSVAHLIPINHLTPCLLTCPLTPTPPSNHKNPKGNTSTVTSSTNLPMKKVPFVTSAKANSLKAAKSSSILCNLFSGTRVSFGEAHDLPPINNHFSARQYKSLKNLSKSRKP